MPSPYLTNAICTPLTENESLHKEGLEAHLDAQWKMGAKGILIGGSMGQMQCLKNDTYNDLIREGLAMSRGQGERLVGVGDTCFERTMDRVRFTEQFDADGIVVLPPYLWKPDRAGIIAYYKTIADQSKKPVFIYHLPVITGVQMDFEMIKELSRHSNIAGIKLSCDYAFTHQVRTMVPSNFRIIPAQPHLLVPLFRVGVIENLDGIYSVFPGLMRRLIDACASENWSVADECQLDLSAMLQIVVNYGVLPACGKLLNAQGVQGKVHMFPIANDMPPGQAEKLMAEPLVKKVLAYQC